MNYGKNVSVAFSTKIPVGMMINVDGRTRKRRAFIEYLEGTEEYQRAKEDVISAKPDPYDINISKREWDRVIRMWRVRLRLSASGTTLCPLMPLYIVWTTTPLRV